MKKRIVLAASAVAAALVLVADGRWQVRMWNNDSLYSHPFNIYALCAHRG